MTHIIKPLDPKDLIAPPDFKNEWREEVSDEQYHADKTALGSSSIKLALKSPNTFYYNHFVKKVTPEKEAFRYGKIVHKALLESLKFQEMYVVEPEFVGYTADGRLSPRSREAKEQKAMWYNTLPPDAIVVTEDERDQIITTIENIMRHEDAPLLLKEGKPEIAGYFRDEETGLRLKIKPDFLSFDGSRLVDIKTSRDISSRRFGSLAYSYRYDFQLYHYATGVKAITGAWPETIWILAIENMAPFECNVIHLPITQIEQAATEYRATLNKIRECIDNGKWPMAHMQAEKIMVPNWFIFQQTEGM